MAKADKSLHDLMQSSGPLPEADALEILSIIASGLAEMEDIIHRDLKPANVLLHNGIWKLADFGLARFIEVLTSSNTMNRFVTAPYAAPEQWRQERATRSTDIYALGCVAYTIINGYPFFLGPDYSHQHQFDRPPKLRASVKLRHLVLSCLSKSPLVLPSTESFTNQIDRIRATGSLASPNPLVDVAMTLAENSAMEETNRCKGRKSMRIVNHRRRGKKPIGHYV
jgi:eukaryotic-like serine/threonine-protein kinase